MPTFIIWSEFHEQCVFRCVFIFFTFIEWSMHAVVLVWDAGTLLWSLVAVNVLYCAFNDVNTNNLYVNWDRENTEETCIEEGRQRSKGSHGSSDLQIPDFPHVDSFLCRILCTSSWRSSLMPKVNIAWKYGLETASRARWAGTRWSSATSTTSQNWLCCRCSLRPCKTSAAWSTQQKICNTTQHHNTLTTSFPLSQGHFQWGWASGSPHFSKSNFF